MKILFLDDDPNRIPLLRNGEELVYVRDFPEFKTWLKENPIPEVISFDHDLATEHYQDLSGYNAQSTIATGEDCAMWAIQKGYIPEIIIVHSWNMSGARRIAQRFIDHGCKDVRVKVFNPKVPHMWI